MNGERKEGERKENTKKHQQQNKKTLFPLPGFQNYNLE